MLPSPGSSIRQDTNRKMHDEMQLQKPKENKCRQTRINEANQQREIFHKIFSPKKFTKFFTIEAINPDLNLGKVNVIKANKELIKALKGTRPKKVDELRNGTLLVEVQSEDQSQSIRELSILNNIPVKVNEHSFLNQTKGTIYYRNRCGFSEEEIKEELAPYKVTNVYRTTKTVANETIPNFVYIITFNMCEIPQEVSIGWNKCRVREYIPRPRRCFKCQGFQHSSKNCRNETDICVNCGQESHGTPCNRPASCKNCNGKHPASSKDCYYYNLANEIVILQTRERINYREAKEKAVKYVPKPENLYSNVTKKNQQATSSIPSQNTKNVKETPKPKEVLNERKRNNSDNSDSEKKTVKKQKPQSALPCTPNLSPVNAESQEMAQPSTPKQATTNLQHQAPPVARKAAVMANIKMTARQPSIEMMDETTQASSQTNRSRSTSRNRQKISNNH